MLQDFKEFIDRGNILDLAVAVVLGIAFAAVVNAFVDYILLAIIGAIFGEPGFSFLDFELNGVIIGLGTFLGAVVQFLLIALGVFLMIKVITAMKKPAEEAPAGPSEIELLTEIRDALRQQ